MSPSDELLPDGRRGEHPAARSEGTAATRTHRLLWGIIALSLLVHVGCLAAGKLWFADARWVHYPLHAAVEASGGLIALWVASMLLALERRRAGTSFNVWIASGLIGMGTLDGMHALMHAGQTFVWLHTSATFLGGLLFATVWCPAAWQRRLLRWWPWSVFLVALACGALSAAFPDLLPPMLRGAEFTWWAKGLNLAGGGLLFAAAGRLVAAWLQTKNTDDLLFCLHCSLFGAAAVMFEQSRLWDLPWWGWHLLRLLAYGVALWFVVLTELGEQRTLSQRTAELAALGRNLQDRIAETTHELREKNLVLERSNQELEQFLYIASHDLQEPLRKIRAFSDLLTSKCGPALDAEARDYLQRMQGSCQRMQALIDDLLTLSRVMRRGEPFRPLELGQVINELLAELQPRLVHSGGQVEVGPLPCVQADPGQMRQLFGNLIGNGLKFTRPGQPPRVIIRERQLVVEAGDERMGGRRMGCIEVRDNGIGFDPQFAERIFRPLQRLHGRGEYEGTGMGLAICRRIVDRHGGRILAEGIPGGGATFVVMLPLSPATKDPTHGPPR